MLTWSDWKTEPRSNRYHYATRFARSLPVLFLQHCYIEREHLSVEPTEISNIDIVNVSCNLKERNVTEIKALLASRGIKRPLVWIYDPVHYRALIDALTRGYRCYHATEDYLTSTGIWNHSGGTVGKAIISLLKHIDFMVACSREVAQTYLTIGKYGGPHAVIENGCDAAYFEKISAETSLEAVIAAKPSAIFQGGINQRLDYGLLLSLAKNMPDWDFLYCGKSVDSEGWNRLLQQPNVRYLGSLPPEDFTRHMCESMVGIIPFIQDKLIFNSLPLKAYEYVACGLPVVTVPISALREKSDLFEFAQTVDEFEIAIRRVSVSRFDPQSIEHRSRVAFLNSYDARFFDMTKALLAASNLSKHYRSRLKIAVLYDNMTSMHVNTIREHVESFEKYSRHLVSYIPATFPFWNRASEDVATLVNFSIFDVVIVHYSVRISILEHFEEGLAQALSTFNGFKVLFIQDEYEGTEIARRWMDRLNFDLVYTCVPKESLEFVYPSYRFPATEFIPTLTGYVPEDPVIDGFAKPLTARKTVIAYRGRKLPSVYGALGQEKYTIGVRIKNLAAEKNIPVDIEVDDSKRIYGTAWYEFLGAARATLGTESGANVFDIDGSLKSEIARLETANPAITFEAIAAKLLVHHEGLVQMNQISPKVFESIRLKTALVLFEGTYSGVVKANEHYIPLKKDFSNINEVFLKLENGEYLAELTNRAYQDIVASGTFSYKNFIAGLDADIDSRVLHRNTQRILQGPMFIVAKDGALTQVLPSLPLGVTIGHHPLGRPLSFVEMIGLVKPRSIRVFTPGARAHISLGYRIMRKVQDKLPFALRGKFLDVARRIVRQCESSITQYPRIFRFVRRFWHRLPLVARLWLARLLQRN
jgi:glycosyltransferase involved in cell wall biosynthesis